jgi:peptide/nickel transport system substrate-binding protein
VSTALLNTQGWKRPRFDAQFNEARATLDKARRQEILDDLQRQLYDEGGDVVWAFVQGPDGARKGVRGIEYAESTPFFAKASLG